MSTNRLPPTRSAPVAVLDESIHLKLPCYEGPEGRGPGVLEVAEEALCRHVFVCGSTGSGKTTLLRTLTQQLISAHAKCDERKPGLVVLDFKNDGTVEHIKMAAAAVGRSADVRVLSLDSDTAYEFFGQCRRIGQANEFAERLQFGCAGMNGGNDVFWNEYRQSLLAAAVTWLVALHSEKRTFVDWISHAAQWLLAERLTSEQRTEIDLLRAKAEELPTGNPERIAIENAVRLIDDWDGVLDPRTRGNARATLQNALRPLLDEPVLNLFRSTSGRKFHVASAVENGRILVVSLNSFLHPHLAALVGRCIKADYFQSVFSRKRGGRFVALIADEYQLVATVGGSRYDDATALPLMREYRAGMVCATQTLVGLDRAIGTINRKLLLANFNTIAFLRSTELELERMAEQICGTVEVDVTIREQYGDSDSDLVMPTQERRYSQRVRRPVCQRGALARLEPGQAYLLTQSGEPCRLPVWFAGDNL